jgi:hypothetical protein
MKMKPAETKADEEEGRRKPESGELKAERRKFFEEAKAEDGWRRKREEAKARTETEACRRKRGWQ